MTKALVVLLLGISLVAVYGCDNTGSGSGDPKNQIGASAKPTTPPPTASVGGGAAPASGGNAPNSQ